MDTKILAVIGIITVLVFGGIFWAATQADRDAQTPGPLDEFAQCLDEKGAIFFGAFWCPHCQDQKTIFGNSARLLPYVECSTPNGQAQTAECAAKGITGYPTWEFTDGTRESRVLSPAELSEKTACPLPEASS